MRRTREEWLEGAERVVEVDGFEFTIRRLSRLEFLETTGRLPILADDGDPARAGAITPARAAAEVRLRVALVAASLVDPTLSPEEVDRHLPPAVVDGLSAHVLEFAGLARPFDGGPSPSNS